MTILGDIGSPTAEVALRIEVDVLVGVPIPGAVAELRRVVVEAVERHTTFRPGVIDVVVRDLHVPDRLGAGAHAAGVHAPQAGPEPDPSAAS